MKLDVSKFSGPCGCGREHGIVIEDICIEPGAIKRLPGLCAKMGAKRPVVLCDSNTWQAAGEAVAALLDNPAVVLLDPLNLHADEHGVEAAEAELVPDADLLLAVGSGTIHDITRYIAARRKLDFISVPTAASVDGFASTVAAMTLGGCKVTVPAVSPRFIVADSDIFSQAPYRLTAAGIGDLLGKYISLADWELSHILTGEYLCTTIRDLTRRAVDHVAASIEEIRSGSREGCEALLYGLVLSGIAMQMIGNSRPASGSEHHISHLWEMGILRPAPDALHGEKVAIGTLLALGEYQRLLGLLKAGKLCQLPPKPYDKHRLAGFFTDAAVLEDILTQNTPDALLDIPQGALEEKTPEITALLETLPAYDRLYRLMAAAGCTLVPADIGMPEELVPHTLELSPYVRNRLTLMRVRRILQEAE